MAEATIQANVLTQTQRNMNTCSGSAKYDEYQDRHWTPYCYDLQQSYFPWYNHCAPGYYYSRTPPEAWCNVPVYTYPHSAPAYLISGDKGRKNSSPTTDETLYDTKDVDWKCESKILPTPDTKHQQNGDITFGLKDDHTVTPMDISPIRPVPSVRLKHEVDRSPAEERASKKNKFLETALHPRRHSDWNSGSRSRNDRPREKRTKDMERKSKVPLEIPLSPKRYSDTDANSCSQSDLPLERGTEAVELGLRSIEDNHSSAALTEMRLQNTTKACRRSLWKDGGYPRDPRKRPLGCNLLPRALKAVRFDREDCVSRSSILDALEKGDPKERCLKVQNAEVVPASDLQHDSEECSLLSACRESDTQARVESGASSGVSAGKSLGRVRESSFRSCCVDCHPSVNGDCSSEVVQHILSGGYEPLCNEEDLNFSSTVDVSLKLGGFILEEPGVLSCHLEKVEDSLTLCLD